MFHSAPLVFSVTAPLAFGVGTVVMDRFDPGEVLRLVERLRITHTHMVPTMFHRLLALPEQVRERCDTSSLRFVLHGAAPCPVPLKQRVIDWLGPVVHEYYAATEGPGTRRPGPPTPAPWAGPVSPTGSGSSTTKGRRRRRAPWGGSTFAPRRPGASPTTAGTTPTRSTATATTPSATSGTSTTRATCT